MSKLCFIDTETGGLDPRKNPILTVSFGIETDSTGLDSNFKVNTFRFRAKDGNMYVDPEALKVNGLTQEQISEFPSRQIEQEKMHSFLSTLTMLYGTLIPVGHNYTFDLGFLAQVMDDRYNCYFDRRYMDTMIIAKFQDYCFRSLSCEFLNLGCEFPNLGYESFSLQGLCKELNIDTEALGGAHTSEGDVKATRLLFYKLCNEFRGWVLDPRDRNTNGDSEKKT